MTENTMWRTRHRVCRCIIFMSFAMSFCIACAGQKPGVDSKIRRQPYTTIDGLVYTRGVHGGLLADMYLPSVPGPKPAVVFIHGGAWKSGDRTQLRRVAIDLAIVGYVGMAIDYDLSSTGDRFPLAVQEAERAVAWLRTNASTYSIDPRRIAVVGSSAGGEIAALIALDRKANINDKIEATVIFNGVLDLSYVGPDAGLMVAPYLGGECRQKRRLCKEASPLQQVHTGAPPFFVGHGTQDRIVPYSQAEAFVQKLRSKHVSVTPFIATNAQHTYWNNAVWYQANIEAVQLFLQTAMPPG